MKTIDLIHFNAGGGHRASPLLPARLDRAVERRRLGLDPDCPTGLVLFRGHGSRAMPHERYDASWIQENGLGIVHRSFRAIDRAVMQLLSQLEEYRSHVGEHENRALFEVPDILGELLNQADRVPLAHDRLAGCRLA